MSILVATDRSSKAVMATVVPKKSTGEFVSKRVVAFMRELGCEMSAVTVKTDNEPALEGASEQGRAADDHGKQPSLFVQKQRGD